MHDGLLLVLSAPSGCGKTTIVKRVMEDVPNLAFSISHTTRSPEDWGGRRRSLLFCG